MDLLVDISMNVVRGLVVAAALFVFGTVMGMGFRFGWDAMAACRRDTPE